jgi:hypothetical protein
MLKKPERTLLWRQLLQTPKTEATIRMLPISRELVDVLRAHCEQSKWAAEDDFMFARTDGTPYRVSEVIAWLSPLPAHGGEILVREITGALGSDRVQ